MEDRRIMDNQWEVTFTKWVNMKLKLRGIQVDNVTEDFKTGVPLLNLLEIIGDECLGKFNSNPKLRIQKVENLNKALAFIKERGVPLTNIGAEDIMDGNEKLVLGLLWIVILRFSIADISEGALSAKEGLLLWCQRKTAGYKDVSVKEFTFSWQDGLAFCALIHRHRPDLLDFDSLNKKNKKENIELAFDIAEKHLGITKLLDVEDLTEIVKPDERSVMTYVALYFHAFSVADKFENAGRRLAKFGNVLETVWQMQHDYESRVTKFIEEIGQVAESWTRCEFDGTYSDAKQQLNEFNKFKLEQKRVWIAEKRDLDTLLSNITTKLRTYNLKPYSPPKGLELQDINAKWQEYVDCEYARRKAIGTQIREIKEKLRVEFSEAANEFERELSQISLALGSLDGDLDAQLERSQQIAQQFESICSKVDVLQNVSARCEEANIEDNDYTVFSLEDLLFDMGLVRQSLNNKIAFIKNQIAARSMTNVTPEQLEEFESAFRHFDRDNTNNLNLIEFKACVSSLGVSFDDAEFEEIFKTLSNTGEIDFHQFVEYMVNITEDKTSISQLLESFKVVSDDRDVITVEDMRKARLDQQTIEFLTAKLKQVDLGYDFESFLKDVFDQ